MYIRVLSVLLLFFNLIPEGLNHVGQPCNKLIRICLASNSVCDEKNICRCRPEYPVNISLHSCKRGKRYSEQCDYSEECYYYDSNSYCTQLPYRSICECHTGYFYSEVKKMCDKAGGESPKSGSLIFPTAVGLSLAFASISCCCLIVLHMFKRQNLGRAIFPRNNTSLRSRYSATNLENSRPTAPVMDESLPTYDIALSLKIAEDCEPPPSYEEVISPEHEMKM